jgi:hypothetical protein
MGEDNNEEMNMRRIKTYAAVALVALTAAVAAGPLTTRAEQGTRHYEVTVTNMAAGQLLSPPLLVTHTRDFELFAVGERASEGVWTIAETGNNAVLAAALKDQLDVDAVVAADAPVHRAGGPGSSSMTLMIESRGPADLLSMAMMLGCTNDGFTGLSAVKLPVGLTAATYYVPGYDAGSEANNQLYVYMPDGCAALGPVALEADGMNQRATTDEVIMMHPGIVAGQGDLTAQYAWGEPVARITIRRVE